MLGELYQPKGKAAEHVKFVLQEEPDRLQLSNKTCFPFPIMIFKEMCVEHS
jgi:hypothetical protein